MKTIPVIALFTILFYSLSLAQPNANFNDQFRDVTAAGPYPIFLTAHWSWMRGNKDFRAWTREEKQLHGWGIDLGMKIVRSLFVELGYERFARSGKGTSEPRLFHNTFSARIGWRRTVFFPLGFHMQMGLFQRHTAYTTFDPGTVLRTLGRFKHSWGLDGRLRFMLLDPAGTGGGMGFFAEGRVQYLFADQTLTFAEPDATVTTDQFYGVFSLGVVIPLALRWRR